jgi:hypothetical protein
MITGFGVHDGTDLPFMITGMRTLYQQRLRATSPSQRDLPQGNRRIPLRTSTETYAAFRSIVSTAKANGALVLAVLPIVLAAKIPEQLPASAGRATTAPSCDPCGNPTRLRFIRHFCLHRYDANRSSVPCQYGSWVL